MRISDWSSDVCSSDLLSPAIQQQLADAGETSFTLGRMSRDAFLLRFDAQRETKEIAFGVEGSIGGGWTYDAHYSHGELDSNSRFYNSRSEERSVGKEWVSPCNSRWSPNH